MERMSSRTSGKAGLPRKNIDAEVLPNVDAFIITRYLSYSTF